MTNLQDIPIPTAPGEVHIRVSPATVIPVVYPFSSEGPGVYATSLTNTYYDGTTEPVTYFNAGIALTLTISTSRLDPGDIDTVRWDLGDGQIAYGTSILHTYRATNPIFVSCAVTDRKGRVVYSGRQLHFRPSVEIRRDTFSVDSYASWTRYGSYLNEAWWGGGVLTVPLGDDLYAARLDWAPETPPVRTSAKVTFGASGQRFKVGYVPDMSNPFDHALVAWLENDGTVLLQYGAFSGDFETRGTITVVPGVQYELRCTREAAADSVTVEVIRVSDRAVLHSSTALIPVYARAEFGAGAVLYGGFITGRGAFVVDDVTVTTWT